MSDSLDRIEKQAQELSADERARLAESMLESLQVQASLKERSPMQKQNSASVNGSTTEMVTWIHSRRFE